MIPQLSYSYDMKLGYQGCIAQSGPKNILTYASDTAIPFGVGLVLSKGSDNVVRLPNTNEIKFELASDLQSGNQINMLVNGVPITTVTYATSHAATMQALASAILSASDAVQTAVVGGTSSRELSLTAVSNKDISITYETISGGASQPALTTVQDSGDDFIGVSTAQYLYEPIYSADMTPVYQYKAKDPIGVMTRGFIWVYIEHDVMPGDAVFLRHLAGGEGKSIGNFRKSDDDNSCIDAGNCRWAMKCSGPGLGMLELNIP